MNEKLTPTRSKEIILCDFDNREALDGVGEEDTDDEGDINQYRQHLMLRDLRKNVQIL